MLEVLNVSSVIVQNNDEFPTNQEVENLREIRFLDCESLDV